jgi:hypothetical protein
VLDEGLLENGLITDEEYAHALPGRLNRAGDRDLRCLVAAHRIDGDDDVRHQAPVSTTARPL